MYNYKLTHTKTGLPFHIEKATIPSDFHIHSHDFSELVIAVNGSAIHIVEGSEFTIQAGDVFVINGKTTHGFVNVNNLAIYNLMYDPSIFYQYPDLKQIGGFQALFIPEPFFIKEHEFHTHLQLEKEAVKITKIMLNKLLRE